MGKVVYYLGAGASANAIPMVAQIPQKLLDLSGALQNHNFPNPNDSVNGSDGPTFEFLRTELLKKLWVIHKKLEAHPHWTIDDYAYDCYSDQNHGELLELKFFLIFCLTQQQIGVAPDHRYRGLLTAISKDYIGNWKDVRIITWNYDYQLELALSECTGHYQNSLIGLQKILNSQPYHNQLANFSNAFSVYRLNGSLTFGQQDDKGDYIYPIDELKNQNLDQLLNQLVKMYYDCCEKFLIKPKLNFAWEASSKEVVLAAKNAMSNANAVVVIGYTFPWVNKDVDTEVFSSIGLRCSLYAQTLEPAMREMVKHLHERLPNRGSSQRYNIEEEAISPPNSSQAIFHRPKEL